jgi:polyphosphate glucokinase
LVRLPIFDEAVFLQGPIQWAPSLTAATAVSIEEGIALGIRVLVIDVGGTHVKVIATGIRTRIEINSGDQMTAAQMVRDVRAATKQWSYDAVSIGFPGPVAHDKPLAEPHNLGTGWVGFDFAKALGKPVKILNDAAMQALGSYQGGRMLFLGLGTGLGAAMILDGVTAPLELAHLPYKNKRTYEEYVGAAGLAKRGKKRWRKSVLDVIDRLRAAMLCDYVVLGGGNAKLMEELPEGVVLGSNENAFAGGFRLWNLDKRVSTEVPDVARSGTRLMAAAAAERHRKAIIGK